MPGLGSSGWKSASVGVPSSLTFALRLMPAPSTTEMSATSALLPPQPTISPLFSESGSGDVRIGSGSKGSSRSRNRMAMSG